MDFVNGKQKQVTGVSVEMATKLARMTLDQMEPIEGGRTFSAPKDDIRFYVTHIYAGENYLSRGPHDCTGKPEIIEWIEWEGTANDIRDKLNAGETEFTVDNHSVKYSGDTLEITNEQEDQPEKD